MTTKLLDSNVCVSLLRAVRPIQERYAAEGAIHDLVLSSVSLSELWYGAEKSARPQVHAERLESFLLEGPPILAFSPEDARVAGVVRADLSRQGIIIGANDLLIASQALARGLTIVTGNVREFSRVRGLKVEDWSRP